MYGLVQAGIITHQALREHLKPYGYAPENVTQGLWIHTDRDINFTLVVDDFGIEYTNKKDADHLISYLKEKYEVTQDWTRGLYCGIKLKWEYKKLQLEISMPGYVKYALQKFQHPTPIRPHHSPHKWTAPKYGSTVTQMARPEDDSPELNTE